MNSTIFRMPAGSRVTFNPALIAGSIGRGLVAGPSFITPGLLSVLLPTPCNGNSLHDLDPADLTRITEYQHFVANRAVQS